MFNMGGGVFGGAHVGASFDASTNLVKSSGFNPAAYTSKFTFSCWFRYSGSNAGQQNLYDKSTGSFDHPVIVYLFNGQLIINAPILGGGDGRAIWDGNAIGITAINDTDWHHILVSFDTTDTLKRHVYIDGVAQSDTGWTTYTSGNINHGLTGGDIYISGRIGITKFVGDLYQLYYNGAEYVDVSVSGNRQKFYNSGKVAMGDDGSIPTGTAPLLFLHARSAGSWGTNRGTGGSFTEVGTITKAASVP